MCLLTKKKKLILLFFCGFIVGICLEIILIEKKKINLVPVLREFRVQEVGSLKETINITCLVLIKHKHLRYIDSSKKTWLKHCSNYRIVSVRKILKNDKLVEKTENGFSQTEKFSLKNKICLASDDVQEISAKNGWAGLCKALHFIKSNHFQWLVISPDSLVVLVENLKLFVRSMNSDEDHYYGYALKNYQADYNVLSAGILLSRGSVNKLLKTFNTEENCDNSGKYWKNEDLYLGKYLKQMNILPKDTRDEKMRGRFHGYNINNILWPGKLLMQSDYNKKALYPVSQGFDCCSPSLITVEVSDPDWIYKLYFFLYKLKTSHKKLPKKVQVNKSEGTYWKEFLKEEGYSETEIKNMTNEEYYKIWEKKLPESKMYWEIQNFLKNNKEQLD